MVVYIWEYTIALVETAGTKSEVGDHDVGDIILKSHRHENTGRVQSVDLYHWRRGKQSGGGKESW